MARKNRIAGAIAITFNGIDFTEWVTAWQDDRGPIVAMHEYLKRDGGEAEVMGRKPHKTKFVLAFMGERGIAAYKKLQAKIDEEPKGPLGHPLHGSMRVACQGFTGAGMDVDGAVNLYNVPLEFIEDAVDTKTESRDSSGPAARENDVKTYNTTMLSLVARFASAAQATQNLSQSALSYAVAAVASVSSATPDPSLSLQLDGVRTDAELAHAEVLASTSDPTASTDASKYSALATIVLLYDACVQLDNSVRALRPLPTIWIVPFTMPLITIAAMFFGKDALAREPSIRKMNPGKIPNPAAVRGGTELLMDPPTVKE